jgi:hypothetical protein
MVVEQGAFLISRCYQALWSISLTCRIEKNNHYAPELEVMYCIYGIMKIVAYFITTVEECEFYSRETPEIYL